MGVLDAMIDQPGEGGPRVCLDVVDEVGLVHPIHTDQQDALVLLMVIAVMILCCRGDAGERQHARAENCTDSKPLPVLVHCSPRNWNWTRPCPRGDKSWNEKIP